MGLKNKIGELWTEDRNESDDHLPDFHACWSMSSQVDNAPGYWSLSQTDGVRRNVGSMQGSHESPGNGGIKGAHLKILNAKN